MSYITKIPQVSEEIGVWAYNNNIRNKLLSLNNGVYFMMENIGAPYIGEYYQIKDRELTSLTNNKGILNFTHDSDSEYSKYINDKYFSNNRDKEIFSLNHNTNEYIIPNYGYPDYIEYMSEVYGSDVLYSAVNKLNGLLASQDMVNALRVNEVGIVKNLDVMAAMQGAVTTNINNFSGTDTKLGLFTNSAYSTMLNNGAIFNSLRNSKDKYITPSMYYVYGNNDSNVYRLRDLMNVGRDSYRINDNFSDGVKISHNYSEIFDNGCLVYLDEAFKTAEDYYLNYPNRTYHSMKNGGYVSYSYSPDSEVGRVVFTDGPFTDTISIGVNGVSRYGGKRISLTYNELDVLSDLSDHGDDRINEEVNQWDGFKVDNTIGDSLLRKTNKLFANHKISTLIGRFHTSSDNGITFKPEFTDTAKTKSYGNSHGRNLLKLDATNSSNDTNGYENPYCRTWTYHHQYNTLKRLIRPFTVGEGDEDRFMTVSETQSMLSKYRSKGNGYEKTGSDYLGENTVLNNNGFINITPKIDENGNTSEIKRCMFSIENLAWVDVPDIENNPYISKEQRGPNNGRIMWFPPYDLNFEESVNVNWNTNSFIGRGEKVHSYSDTDRNGTLSFTLLIDHPSIVNSLRNFEGMGEEKDPDADILRFFAGCSTLTEGKNNENVDNTITQTLVENTVSESTNEIRFYVHFPNNLSGSICKSDGSDMKVNFDGVYTYLLTGYNAMSTFNEDEDKLDFEQIKKWNGFEMIVGKGISTMELIDEKDAELAFIPSCKTKNNNRKIGIEGCLCDGNNGVNCSDDDKYYPGSVENGIPTGKYCYRYMVDSDLRQIYESEYSSKYFDEGSKCFNSKLNANGTNNATCSYAEFTIACLFYNKNKEVRNVPDFSEFRDNYENVLTHYLEGFVTRKRESNIVGYFVDDEPYDLHGKEPELIIKDLFKYMLDNEFKVELSYEGKNILWGTVKSKDKIYRYNNYDYYRLNEYVEELYYLGEFTILNDDNNESYYDKYDVLLSYVIYCGGDIERIRELVSLFNSNPTYKSLSFEGSATKQDIANSEMLAKRRAFTMKNFVEKMLSKSEIEVAENRMNGSASETDVDGASSDNSKFQRNTFVTITYSTSNTNKVSDNTTKSTIETKTSEEDALINDFYNSLIKKSDILQTYSEDENFKSEIINYIQSNEISYDLVHYTFNDWKTLINNIIDMYSKEYIILSYSVSDKNTNSSFNEKLNDIGIIKNNIITKVSNKYYSNVSSIIDGDIIDYYTSEDNNDYYIYDKFNLRDINFKENGSEEPIVPYGNYRFSFNKVFNDYLVMEWIESLTESDYSNYIDYIVSEENFDRIKILLLIKYSMNNIDLIENEEIKNILNRGSDYLNDSYYDSLIIPFNNGNYSDQDVDNLLSYVESELESESNSISSAGNVSIIGNDNLSNKQDISYINKDLQNSDNGSNENSLKNEPLMVYDSIEAENNRYENEAEYFSNLNETDPFIFKSLKEKYKYFTPAFHSISPEGFNARLTFLQQCTRQGHTLEKSSENGSYTTAGNLSFGRMPVCVLRIGDFINSRIIINSMTINYQGGNGMQWDLNPEGAGVQPMFAKVSLAITMLGGSSLTAPINRLQNALTFNYYANTGVYDNRSDIAEILNNGSSKSTTHYHRLWSPKNK